MQLTHAKLTREASVVQGSSNSNRMTSNSTGGVVVIGASGFIGTHLMGCLGAKGVAVSAVHYDRSNGRFYGAHGKTTMGLRELFKEAQPAAVVYAAGGSSVGASWENPTADFDANVASFQAVLEGLRESCPQARTIYLSSAAVFGEGVDEVLTEHSAKRPISPYGWHKLMAETLVEAYACNYGLPLATVRLFSVVGPGQKKLLIWDAMQQLRQTGHLELRGTGNEERDFLSIADTIDAIAAVVERGEFRGESYNVASGQSHSIRDVANILCEVSGSSAKPIFTGVEMAGYPRKWRVDITRLRQLAFAPKLALRESIEAAWKWYANELHHG